MKNMSDEDWDLVTLVHLKGAFSCTKACWPLFRQQKVCSREVQALMNSLVESSILLLLLVSTETLVNLTILLQRVSPYTLDLADI
jgi:NAD(P)-dependent dehydrogenase (short-subunit alcohol dehydrogenase family)